MAEIRCPMCGEDNPDSNDICQFCQARLKPLVISSSDNESPSLPEDDPLHTDEAPTQVVSAADCQETQSTQSDTDEKPIQSGEAPPTKDKPSEEEEVMQAWLRNLRDQDDQPTPEQPTKSSPLGGDQKTDSERILDDDSVEKDSEHPDWLIDLRGKMEDIETSSSEDSIDETVQTADEPDWLSRLDGSQPDSEVDNTEHREEDTAQPDDHHPPPVSPFTMASEDTSDDSLPEWLTDLVQEAGSAASPASMTEISELPQLNKDSQAERYPLPGSEDGFEQLSQAERDFSTLEAQDQDTLTQAEAAGELESEKDVKPSIPNPISSSDETTDWLSSLRGEAEDVGDKGDQTPPPSTLPKTLTGERHSEEPSSTRLETEAQDSTDAATPPALISEDDDSLKENVDQPGFDIEVPDWLSDIKPPEKPGDHDLPEGDQPDLQPVELPSWVRAMRPIESVVAETPGDQVDDPDILERHGPLSGLRGVIPMDPGLGIIRKPPTYSSRLKINESQQRHAERLESMISSESKQKSLPREGFMGSFRLLRWIIAALLLLAAGIPLVSGMQFVPSTSMYPNAMREAFFIISELPPNAPVLISFDYEPALSGELEAAAEAMIDHLLFRGARLTFISTSPTGPMLAERFMEKTQSEHQYQHGEQYINLGYLAGGPTGISSFVNHPPVAAPETIFGELAWLQPPLRNVFSLSDFAAFIILTDNADTGRVWIEQAGPHLDSSPILMVISAQAEPMIRPYFDSGQVKGLVTGLFGGKTYEQTIQRPGLAQKYWDAFSFSLLVSVLVIFSGSTWSVIAKFKDQRSPFKKDRK